MRRTGSTLTLLALLAAAPALAAEVEFYQTVDRTRVGTDDTFRLTIVVGGAPEGATVQFPAPKDFEVISRSTSTQMSYQLGSGGSGVIKRVQKYTLVMRANRTGSLKIPPSVLATGAKDFKTEAITMEVVKGRLGPDPAAQAQAQRRQANPFGGFPGFPGLGDDDDPFGTVPDPEIPRSDSDLFLKESVDKETAYVGEQVTLTLTIYSRVDLSSVDAVNMPKLEGFWSEDLDTPTQLAPEPKTLNGVQYHAYLLRRRALFPVKAGNLEIGAAEADITTGFLFAGRRVHRKGNPVTVKVKPLPPAAAGANVGRWRLSTELSVSQVAVGTPVQIKVILEGKGNLKNATVPRLVGPPGVKIYEPTTTDKLTMGHGVLGGKRTMEYVVLPQQTGVFSLPGLSLKYFNPDSGQLEESKTDALTLNVRAGEGGSTVAAVPSAGVPDETAPKNRLEGGGLKALRHTANFAPPTEVVWARPWFLPAVAGPFSLSLLFGLVGLLRRSRNGSDPAALKRKLARAARARLAAAEKIRNSGKTTDFYNEVEKALSSFLEAKLSLPVVGLTRVQLDERMSSAGVSQAERTRVKGVLDTCDMGRFAPGMGDSSARARALDEAAAAMEAWDTK